MGADMVGYILVGPSKLRVTEARAKKLSDMAVECARVGGTRCPDCGAVYTDEECPACGRKDPGTEGLLAMVTSLDEATKVLHQAANEWQNLGGCRDAATRRWQDKSIVFAGEMSWGDEPGGWAYKTIKMWLPIWQLMGVG